VWRQAGHDQLSRAMARCEGDATRPDTERVDNPDLEVVRQE
jgi:hypothetical protein